MTIAEALLQEINTLPEQKQAEVLAFARFLKIGLSDEQRFKSALLAARRIAKSHDITDADIEEEILQTRRDC